MGRRQGGKRRNKKQTRFCNEADKKFYFYPKGCPLVSVKTNLKIFMNKKTDLNLSFKKHTKPRSETEFGYFLAGLVDADGYFTKTGGLSLSFHNHDLPVALTLRKILGGSLYKYKKVRALSLNSATQASRQLIYRLLHDKLQIKHKIDHFNTRFASKLTQICQGEKLSLNNHYMAGFLQGDGSFQIKIKPPHARSKKHQVELRIDFELKHRDLLEKIQAVFGLGFRAKRHTYTLSSVNLTHAQTWATYLSNYQPMGASLRLSLIWSHALSLVLKKAHLTESGLDQVRQLKALLSAYKQSSGLRVKNQTGVKSKKPK